MLDYIDVHKDEFGIEPICSELQFAPSTYYAAKTRPPSAHPWSVVIEVASAFFIVTAP